MSVPAEIQTERLLLRPWRSEDAAALHPILETNWEHLGPWIPARVATPAPIPVLAERLAGFAKEFAADREWRYAMLARTDAKVLGEVGLFPRSATARVPFADADRVELGYWLRSDETGRGIVTEAARAAIAAAAGLGRFSSVEIRCDARNEKSSAVPKRLGFALSATIGELQVWTLALGEARDL
jgi:RimJ/RimL family protein N-acetyltransferase